MPYHHLLPPGGAAGAAGGAPGLKAGYASISRHFQRLKVSAAAADATPLALLLLRPERTPAEQRRIRMLLMVVGQVALVGIIAAGSPQAPPAPAQSAAQRTHRSAPAAPASRVGW